MGDFLDFAGRVVEVLHLIDEGVFGFDNGGGDVEGAFDAS